MLAMSEALLEQILMSVVRLALSMFGPQRTQAIIQAEYDAVDITIDEFQRRKFAK